MIVSVCSHIKHVAAGALQPLRAFCSPFVHMRSSVIMFPQITWALTFVSTRLRALAFVPRLLSSVSLSSSSCSPLLTVYLQIDSSERVQSGPADLVLFCCFCLLNGTFSVGLETIGWRQTNEHSQAVGMEMSSVFSRYSCSSDESF